MKKFKLSDKVLDYFIQVVLIVGSVLLALWLDQLMADRVEKRKMNIAFKNIVTEVRNNRSDLDVIANYHFKMAEGLNHFIDSVDFSREDKNAINIISPFLTYGLNNAELQKTAWNMATETEVVALFDYEIAYDLTKLYDLQFRGVESTTEKIMNYLTDPSLFRVSQNEEVVKVFSFAISELASQEAHLAEKYDEFLEKYQ